MNAGYLDSILSHSNSTIVDKNREFDVLLTDSRHLALAERSIFFAIPTKRNSGFRYVPDLYADGVRNFVVPSSLSQEQTSLLSSLTKANVWFVDDVVFALQQVAASKRSAYQIPVIGVTGSNGKTIVKDWLTALLSVDMHVVSSPKSYNSQIGVPLSVWQLSSDTEIAIFETGISMPGEMDRLRHVIKPSIGIFTNIGQAHDENFLSREHKLAEKLKLFTQCQTLVYCIDHRDIHSALVENPAVRSIRRFSWGTNSDADVRLVSVSVHNAQSTMLVEYQYQRCSVVIPFIDRASVENAMHCVATMLLLGYSLDTIAERAGRLQSVEMHLEMKEGINGCQIINDGYSLDVNSLDIALEVMQHDRIHNKKTLIMSDFIQSGIADDVLYSQVANQLLCRNVSCFIGIGPDLCRNSRYFSFLHGSNGDIQSFFYPSVETFLHNHPISSFCNETILLKGARIFHFEDIASVLQRKSHETVLEVNMDALVNNLNYYRSLLRPSTKLMAMVKADSYGAGKIEVANVLQYNHVDYLTVAYSDEGVALRQGGITLPIMVMNPEEQSFDDIIQYGLEPDIYSFRILELFTAAVKLFCADGRKISVHIELDTGMHRLGFGENDLEELAARLSDNDSPLQVCSIFSHLACSEDNAMDDFTNLQISRFRSWSDALKQRMNNPSICCHILNSSGIIRFPEAQMDMVRLGIGLYGYAPDEETQQHLQPVSRLRTRVSQIKDIPAGDSVGYNRRWIAHTDSRIAIIPIGYADGLNRHLGYERCVVRIGDHLASIIGSICMDMCFIDVTDIPCEEGDEVIVFDDAEQMQRLTNAADTISYEILTSVSPRVKRIYYRGC